SDWKGFDVAPSVRTVPVVNPGTDEAELDLILQRQPRPIDGPVPCIDLATIDRSVPREPGYRSQPRYCLLVFGAEAKTRIWLVLDGDTLYVDANGQGSWIIAEKKMQGRDIRFRLQEIFELDGTRHTDLTVNVTRSGIYPSQYLFHYLNLKVRGLY